MRIDRLDAQLLNLLQENAGDVPAPHRSIHGLGGGNQAGFDR
jgi:DNA-binding Lrp family transcriptional regulator